MSTNALAVKSPNAELIWRFDFTDEVPIGVTVSAIDTTVPSPLVEENETADLANKRTDVRISGGTHGRTYLVKSIASLSNGEEVEGFLTLRVLDSAA